MRKVIHILAIKNFKIFTMRVGCVAIAVLSSATALEPTPTVAGRRAVLRALPFGVLAPVVTALVHSGVWQFISCFCAWHSLRGSFEASPVGVLVFPPAMLV